MAKMKAIMAAVLVMEKEGVSQAFGVPGAAINPLYAALRERGTIAHVLARHVEGASHMAEGYTRAVAGHIGVCIGTCGPAGTDMVTGPVLGQRRQHPDPVHHRPGAARAHAQGGLPGGGHHRHRQAGDQVGDHRAGAGAGAARLPAGLPPDALGPPGPGADRPAVRRADGRDRVRHRHLRAAAGLQARGDAQADREGDCDAAGGRAAADRRRRRHHQRRCLRSAGAVCRNGGRAGDPHADGLGHHPRRPPADGRHVRSADLAPLRQRDDAGQRLRARHRQPLGEPPHRHAPRSTARAAPSCTSTSSRRRSAASSRPTWASSRTPRRRCSCSSRWRRDEGGRPAEGPQRLGRPNAASASARCCARPTTRRCR